MKKSLISIALILLSVSAYAYDFAVVHNGKAIYCQILSSTEPYTVAVTNSGKGSYSGAVTIPASVISSGKSYVVTSIGSSAFNGCTALTSVTIPSSVTSIESGAFGGCTGLTDIVLEDGTATLSFENKLFENCPVESVYIGRDISYYSSPFRDKTTLTLLTMGDSVTVIEDHAFYGCTGLAALTIGNSVTSIGWYAFGECTGLTEVTIPNSVTSIEVRAFYGCTGLAVLTIGNSVTSMGWHVFSGCTGLTALTIGNSVTEIGQNAFSGCTGLMEVTIPNSVTSIGKSAFSGCTGLTAITIPNSVTSIESFAFYRCTGLTELTIPNSVTSIGSFAFWDCSGLTALAISSSVTSIEWGAFYGCTGLTKVIIPNSVTVIENQAFYGCTGLTEVIIPNSVTVIEYQAFYGCTGLTKVIIPNSVTVIAGSVFYGCSGLTEVTIPNSVTVIGRQAFYGCSGLTEVTIPNSVTWIGYEAFRNCTGLTALTIPNSVTEIEREAFSDCTGLKNIVLEDGTTTLSFEYGEFENCPVESVYIGRDISHYPYDYSPFRGKTTLTSLTIGNLVTEIVYFDFSGCSGLKDIVLEDGTATLSFGSNTFEDCPVESVYLGRNIFHYNSFSPFRDKTTLTSLTIGDSVTSIEWGAFPGCTGLTALTIPNSVTEIRYRAFDGCTGLTELTIPNSVTEIGIGAFSGCTGLKNIVLEDGYAVLFLKSEAFENCPVESVYIGRDISYYSSPFRDKTTLTTLTIGNSVTSIEEWAFYNCTGLTSITVLKPTPPDVANNTFDGINKDACTLYVPVGSQALYSQHPLWREFLNMQEILTGVNRIEMQSLQVYPNPVKANLFIKSELPVEKVEIYDLQGKQIVTGKIENGQPINVSHLPKGVYLVKVYTDKGVAINKLLKE
jgi:hypothetical protein